MSGFMGLGFHQFVICAFTQLGIGNGDIVGAECQLNPNSLKNQHPNVLTPEHPNTPKPENP